MQARRFESKDFAQIKAWAKEYGAEYDEKLFPKTGFIVDGVAAYFLYATDSHVCFLENLIANPKASRDDRDAGIDLVLRETLKEAKERGFHVAYATTDNPKVVVRAMLFGAKAQPKQVLLTKNLTGPS